MIKGLLKKTFLYKKYRERIDRIHAVRVNTANGFFRKEAEDVLRLFSEALYKDNIHFWIENH